MAPLSRSVRETATFFGTAVLASYAQVLFSRSRWVGALLLVATAASPRALLFGLVAVTVAVLVALAMRFDRPSIESGMYGYPSLLVGLGIAVTFDGGAASARALVLAATATVVVTAALRAALGAIAGLPSLSLPFLAVFYLVLAAAPLARLPVAAPAAGPPAFGPLPAGFAGGYFESLGALFFLPRVDAGLAIFAALLVSSRVAAVYTVGAFALVTVLDAHVLALPDVHTVGVLGYNAMLAAVALGGIWFVPSRASALFAAFGVFVCALVTVGSMPVLARMGVPVLILPFNVTVLLLLYAMRQRVRDGAPKAVDFAPGTPEENLGYHRTRQARFGASGVVTFRLPFLGAWQCTQGFDGPVTHRAAWRHGLDFEVVDRDGSKHRDDGSQLPHYRAYRMPVVATAAGTVVRVVDGVRDNKPGELNLEQKWGNAVVVAHGWGVHSVVAHLAPGSVKVREGQIVQAGDTLGLCGNSGRSAVPHIHFQLQTTATLGGPTMPVAFDDVVVDEVGGVHRAGVAVVPAQGDTVRSVEPGDEADQLLRLPYGERIAFERDGRVEHVRIDVDLAGQTVLRSEETGASLVGGRRGASFVFYDLVGRSDLLEALLLALPRLPLEIDDRLEWGDRLARQRLRGPVARLLSDLVSPLVDRDDLPVRCHMRREGKLLVVHTASVAGAGPSVSGRVELERGVGLRRIELSVDGRSAVYVRSEPGARRAGQEVGT